MCGIVGVGGLDGRQLVEGLVGSLAHRGPDDEGIWNNDRLALGHRRLTIIGLDPAGAQPMVSRSGNSVISFNGEIYNFQELADELETAGRPVDRRFDTSILIEALEHWGTAVLPRLNGMFAFVWYRPREDRLLLGRDRWGKKPLFWGRVPIRGKETLVIASELRIFAQLPDGPPAADPLGIARYLVYDGMPDSRTVYRGVEKVPAAEWVELDSNGRPSARGEYWQLERQPTPSSGEEAEERFTELLDRSLSLRLRSDVPVGLFLSGGIDSSLLAATWRRAAPDSILRTFTVGFEDPSYDERSPAALMAKAVGAEHHEILVGGQDLERELDCVWEHLSEPFSDPSILPVSALCRFARERVTVALGGDGADELQAGYDPFRAWDTARRMERTLGRRLSGSLVRAAAALAPVDDKNMSLGFRAKHFAQGFLHPPSERIQGWMAGFPVATAMTSLHPDLVAQIEVGEILEPTRRAYEKQLHHGERFAQISAWIKTYLESSILTKIDRAGMMHSLEIRAPFLDPELAHFLFNLPEDLVFAGGKGKVLLRRAAAQQIPPALLRRKKKGLGVPQATWLRTVLRDRMEACLDLNSRGGWFRHDQISRLWSEHLHHKADHRRALWTFLFSFPFQH